MILFGVGHSPKKNLDVQNFACLAAQNVQSSFLAIAVFHLSIFLCDVYKKQAVSKTVSDWSDYLRMWQLPDGLSKFCGQKNWISFATSHPSIVKNFPTGWRNLISSSFPSILLSVSLYCGHAIAKKKKQSAATIHEKCLHLNKENSHSTHNSPSLSHPSRQTMSQSCKIIGKQPMNQRTVPHPPPMKQRSKLSIASNNKSTASIIPHHSNYLFMY